MRLPPPEVVATWPAPNYINPETRGPALIIVELITLPIAIVCLALRLYVRFKVLHTSHWDDWMMVGAAIGGAGVTTCVVLAFTRYGWELHIWDLTLEKLIAGRQVSFAAQALFVPATALAKLSILTSYLRLAPRDTTFRRMTFAGIWFILIINIAYFIVLFTQCRPISNYWNLLSLENACIPEAPALLSQAIVTALCDFFVWALPLPALYRAKLPLGQRLALIALFSFGLVGVVSAAIRAYWIHYVVQETYDVTWYGFHLWMWTAIEVQLGVICGCVPWLKSLFKFWRTSRRITDITDKPQGSRSDGGHRTSTSKGSRVSRGSKAGAVVRMDSFGKGLAYEKRGSPRPDRDEYLDLERYHIGPHGAMEASLTFPDPLLESVPENPPRSPSETSLDSLDTSTTPPKHPDGVHRFPSPPPPVALPARTPGLALSL